MTGFYLSQVFCHSSRILTIIQLLNHCFSKRLQVPILWSGVCYIRNGIQTTLPVIIAQKARRSFILLSFFGQWIEISHQRWVVCWSHPKASLSACADCHLSLELSAGPELALTACSACPAGLLMAGVPDDLTLPAAGGVPRPVSQSVRQKLPLLSWPCHRCHIGLFCHIALARIKVTGSSVGREILLWHPQKMHTAPKFLLEILFTGTIRLCSSSWNSHYIDVGGGWSFPFFFFI